MLNWIMIWLSGYFYTLFIKVKIDNMIIFNANEYTSFS